MFTSIILQSPNRQGGWSCVWSNVHHLAEEVRIVIAPGDASVQTRQDVARLTAAVRHQLLLLGLGPIVPGPCLGQIPSGGRCQLAFVRELLVLVGDGSRPLALPALFAPWHGEILPVLPTHAQPHAAGLLAGLGADRLAAFHPLAPQDVAATVLRAARVLEENPRVFLSYKRGDTAALALQLFRALTEQGIDVFLDGSSLAPAHVLTQKIRAQLGNKGVVLLLASPAYLRSVWCRMELVTAASLNLGMLVVATPGAPSLPLAAGAPRIDLKAVHFQGGSPGPNAVLKKTRAEAVARALRGHYDRVLLRRRQQLFLNTTLALRSAGCLNVVPAADGCLEARSNPTYPAGLHHANYRLALTHRSPELEDFYRAAHPAVNQRVVVLGLNAPMEPEAVALRTWLEQQTGASTADHALLTWYAPRIANGSL